MVSFCLACFHAKPENMSSLSIGIGVSLNSASYCVTWDITPSLPVPYSAHL